MNKTPTLINNKEKKSSRPFKKITSTKKSSQDLSAFTSLRSVVSEKGVNYNTEDESEKI